MSEGKVVRYFKSLNIPGDRACGTCGNPMGNHGELFNVKADDYELVCPGDYIISTPNGHYKLPRKDFELMYEPYPISEKESHGS